MAKLLFSQWGMKHFLASMPHPYIITVPSQTEGTYFMWIRNKINFFAWFQIGYYYLAQTDFKSMILSQPLSTRITDGKPPHPKQTNTQEKTFSNRKWSESCLLFELLQLENTYIMGVTYSLYQTVLVYHWTYLRV